MTKKIKNISGSEKTLKGKIFPNQFEYEIPEIFTKEWALDTKVQNAISNDEFQILDGTNVVEKNNAIDFLKTPQLSDYRIDIPTLSETNLSSALDTLGGLTDGIFIESTSTHSTSSSKFSIITGTQITPTQGKYFVQFNCSLETIGINAEGELALFKDGNKVGSTIREIRDTSLIGGLITLNQNNGAAPSTTSTIVNFDGIQTIDARVRIVSGSSISCGERSLIMIKIKDT